ncbi:hypothetical protein H0H81_009791 [Sphagnurus paluster]|uniref:F-box domain-containing protein n=1 Tax=Sphagnurus paluster TaxID=117069 RepID=A0A9P7K6H3_9AGAR|nr:hypothetical protein H0H81_009791 [Sphagnurus paluster]
MLLRLPPELIVRVLFHLDLIDLLRAKQVHPSLKTAIESFPVLQYRIETQLACVEDNKNSDLPISERLRLLRNRQEAWSKCSIDFRRTLTVPQEPSGIYDLVDGVYILGDANRHTLHYVRLPSSIHEELRWEKINISKPLVDMGVSIHENDLIAVVTKSTHPSDPSKYVLEIQLLQFSTGASHPRAHLPVLFVCELTEDHLAVYIEIVGPHLAVNTNRYLNEGATAQDYLYVFDWMTGEQKMSVKLPPNTYSGLLFLSPELILLPNMDTSALDIWRIPTSEAQDVASNNTGSQTGSPAPRPILSLTMPSLTPMYSLLDLTCRAEPNPTGSLSSPAARTNSKASSQPPFRPTATNALLTFTMRIHDLTDGNIIAWSMHARRADVLAMCEQALGPMEDENAPVRERDVGTRPAGEGAVMRAAAGASMGESISEEPGTGLGTSVDEPNASVVLEGIIGEGSGRLVRNAGTEEEIVIEWSLGALAGAVEDDEEDEDEDLQDQNSGVWISEGEDDSEDEGFLFGDLPNAMHPPVPYATWGAPITRLVLTSDAPTRWITTSAGTRCLSFVSSSAVGNTRLPWALQVLDFNPYTVRRAALRDAAIQSSHVQVGSDTPLDTVVPSGQGERQSTSDNWEMGALRRLADLARVTAQCVFREPLGSTLQCTTTFASKDDSRDWDFQGVLMDDERLVGLKIDPSTDQISEIVVMHIGLGV